MIIYEGPSAINQEPIVAILTGINRKSKNPKTGEMAQLWILPKDKNPLESVYSGYDRCVCGDCPYRRANKGGCYVQVYQAPNQIYKAYKKGNYQKAKFSDLESIGENQIIRLGAYGDPAMIPIRILNKLVKKAKGYTGYTHQWKKEWVSKGLKNLCMASVDTPEQLTEARKAGWRSFIVTHHPKSFSFKLALCPASEEAGKKVTCSACKLCSGKRSTSDKRKDVYIAPHGRTKNRFE